MSAKYPSIKIGRPGTFTSAEGQTVTFTAADFERTVAAYTMDSAPIVIGHPFHDEPAYGRIAKLSFDGRFLTGQPSSIAEPLVAAVRAGRYRNVSGQFYPPSHPSNPSPGVRYLKHVGVLGGAAPAMKGLGALSFAEANEVMSFGIDASWDAIRPQTILERTAAIQAIAPRLSSTTARQIAMDEAELDRLAADTLSFADDRVRAETFARSFGRARAALHARIERGCR